MELTVTPMGAQVSAMSRDEYDAAWSEFESNRDRGDETDADE